MAHGSWLLAHMLLSFSLIRFAGCASTRPSRFYIPTDLFSLESPPQGTTAGQGPAIGVEPVTRPKYVDHPQFASHASPYELAFAEFERLAEPLDTNVTCALVEHLARLTPDGDAPRP